MTQLKTSLFVISLVASASAHHATAQTKDSMFLAGGVDGWKCNENLKIKPSTTSVLKIVKEHGSPAQYMASSWCVGLCKATPGCIAVSYTHTYDAQGDAHTCTLFGAVAGTEPYPTVVNKQWGAACIKISAFTWRPLQPKTFDDVQPQVPGDWRSEQDRTRPAIPDHSSPGSRRP